MATQWTVDVYDFLSFSESLTYKPAYLVVGDSLSFNESLTVPIFRASFSDGISFNDEPLKANGGSIHHLTVTDSMTFVDDMMKGAPQALADHMVLVDEFDVAANLIVDSFVFSDTMTGVDTLGLPDSFVFSDTFTLNFVWGSVTCNAPDTMTFADYMNALGFSGNLPNPWIPNYPTTTRRSGNPTCEQSDGQEGLPY